MQLPISRILDRSVGRLRYCAVRMDSRRLVTVGVLVVWVLLGPIAVSFGNCTGMGAMCEGPCGSTSCVALTASVGPVPPAGYLVVKPPDYLQTPALKVYDPPPKSLRLFA